MADTAFGYKAIAVVSFVVAVLSCESNSNSVAADPEVLARLDTIDQTLATLQASVDTMQTSVTNVQAAVAPPGGTRQCTLEEFIDNTLPDGTCDKSQFPEGVGVSTTYCIDQGWGLELGGAYKLEANYDVDAGAGWPNVLWGKITGKAKTAMFGTTVGVWPSEIAAGASTGLGRGLSICVDVPLEPTPEQVSMIRDLVLGVNEQDGTYSRRTNRLLNYAARRTPVAVATPFPNQLNQVGGMSAMAMAPEDDDKAFDVVDDAIERFVSGQFNRPQNAVSLFQDPVFTDLASALELPSQIREGIADPARVFDVLRPINASNITATCDTMGFDAGLRARFPNLDTQCLRLAQLPNYAAHKAITTRLGSMYTASGLRNFICSNVTLAVLAPSCR